MKEDKVLEKPFKEVSEICKQLERVNHSPLQKFLSSKKEKHNAHESYR